VPITNTFTLQGGAIENEETGAEAFVGALNGETLSKTPQNVPSGRSATKSAISLSVLPRAKPKGFRRV
jgi:hypothetical protein